MSNAYFLRSLRHHPDEAGAWLYKEDWPLGGVWRINGTTRLGADEAIFKTHWLDPFLHGDITGVEYVALLWARRGWLKEHARRVPRALWHRGIRI
ncbi:hypothetical protein [Pseudoroseomonas cervicalis]|uniref:hypothetical protein n=1 Tax=Teichococcus cervicalis TaxID=204525 RepID=UPI00277FE545|nr:hypothetical protein [Pseudoroseomonas cervicalis]MDQ1077568.1 hypothetical protein [Pseudoroseomonas cervicalis]